MRPVAPARTAGQRRQALVEAERRSQGGIYLYLPGWLAIAAAGGLFQTDPPLVAAVAAACAAIGSARFLLHRRFADLALRRERLARNLFLTLLLGSGAIPGLLGAAAVLWPPLGSIAYPLMLAAGVACASATLSMAMQPAVRFGMPLATLLPIATGLAVASNPNHLGIAVLIALFAAHGFKASRHAHDDYWRGVEAEALLVQREGELGRLSITDPLTQIHTRQYFERRLTDEWRHAIRRSEPLTLMLIDLDHFKRINDTRGHSVGDVCLLRVAAALETSLSRSTDLLARYGGEEFVVLLPVTEADAASKVAERLRRAVAATVVELPGGPVSLTCSIGLATVWPSFQGTMASALASADAALAQAKAGGRDRVVVAGAGEAMTVQALMTAVRDGAPPLTPAA